MIYLIKKLFSNLWKPPKFKEIDLGQNEMLEWKPMHQQTNGIKVNAFLFKGGKT